MASTAPHIVIDFSRMSVRSLLPICAALPRAWPRIPPTRKGLYSLEAVSANGRKQTLPAALETPSYAPPIRRFERELPPVSLEMFWRSAPIIMAARGRNPEWSVTAWGPDKSLIPYVPAGLTVK